MYVGIYFVFLAACSLQFAKAAVANQTRDNYDDSKIVFPGPIQELETRHGKENKTHPCEGQTFCTVKPDDYPQELFNRLFKGKFKEPVFQPTSVMVDDRLSDSDEMSDCESKVTFEPLYQVRNLMGNWLTVAQAPEENFVQLVRLETCANAGSQCFNKFTPPVDLEPFCKQKYNVWTFLVHDGKEGTEPKEVVLPVCCVCQYRVKKF